MRERERLALAVAELYNRNDQWPLCGLCWWHHPHFEPHNAEAIVYHLEFMQQHGRPPSWRDAMAHCSPDMQRAWTQSLTELGYDVDAPVELWFKQEEEETVSDVQPTERIMGSDAAAEDIAQAKGGERVKLQDILDKVTNKAFFRVDENGPNDGGTMTICILTMRNGFKFQGSSALMDPTNFDKAYGESLAYDKAINQAWSHEAYLRMELRFLVNQPGSAEAVPQDDAGIA